MALLSNKLKHFLDRLSKTYNVYNKIQCPHLALRTLSYVFPKLIPCVLADQSPAILVFVYFLDTPCQCSLVRDDLRAFVQAILSAWKSLPCTMVNIVSSYYQAFALMWYLPYQTESFLDPCLALLLSQHVMLLGIIRFHPVSSFSIRISQ